MLFAVSSCQLTGPSLTNDRVTDATFDLTNIIFEELRPDHWQGQAMPLIYLMWEARPCHASLQRMPTLGPGKIANLIRAAAHTIGCAAGRFASSLFGVQNMALKLFRNHVPPRQ